VDHQRFSDVENGFVELLAFASLVPISVPQRPEGREEDRMNDQERNVISDIFRRLEQVAQQPRDPQAEQLIAEKLRQQPYAPYAMAQAIFVQERALENLQAEVESLRRQIDASNRQPQQSGGFLSGIFGGNSNSREQEYREPPRQAAPWGRTQEYPQQGMPQQGGFPQQGFGQSGPWGSAMRGGGGGFLQSALTTAAGVAGGMMVANALSGAFSGLGEAGKGLTDQVSGLADTAGNAVSEAGNNLSGVTDSLHQNANVPEDGGYDVGGDGGDEGDWT
jgi:hypothetical protein